MKSSGGVEQMARCPVCGSDVEMTSLGRTGLSSEELCILGEHVKNGTLKDVLRIAEIALRRIDPERTSVEFQVNDSISKLKEASDKITEKFMQQQKQFIQELSQTEDKEKTKLIQEYEEKQTAMLKDFQKQIEERVKTVETLEKERLREFTELNQSMKEIREKIIGTGIGDVGETITVVDLKKTVSTDSFSEVRAAKHGTDIVATVKERGKNCGKITVSVKYQNTWSNDFMTQLAKNMREDGTRWGMLVTKKFPKEALSTKAWITEDDAGNTVILVKPEYAPVTYIGLRQAAIHWFEARQLLKNREAEVSEAEKTAKALTAWINGEEFEETVRYIDSAKKEAEKTTAHLHQLHNYVSTKITEAVKLQDFLVEHLMHAKNLIGRLRELLNGTPETSSGKEARRIVKLNPIMECVEDLTIWKEAKAD